MSKRIVGLLAVSMILATLAPVMRVSADPAPGSCPPDFLPAVTIEPASEDRNGDGIVCIKSVPPSEGHGLTVVTADNNSRA